LDADRLESQSRVLKTRLIA